MGRKDSSTPSKPRKEKTERRPKTPSPPPAESTPPPTEAHASEPAGSAHPSASPIGDSPAAAEADKSSAHGSAGNLAPASVPNEDNEKAASIPPNAVATTRMVDFTEIQRGMVVETSKARIPADLATELGLADDDPISKTAPEDCRHSTLR